MGKNKGTTNFGTKFKNLIILIQLVYLSDEKGIVKADLRTLTTQMVNFQQEINKPLIYASLRCEIRRVLNDLEKKGIISKLIRNDKEKGYNQMGRHYYYRIIDFDQIYSQFLKLPSGIFHLKEIVTKIMALKDQPILSDMQILDHLNRNKSSQTGSAENEELSPEELDLIREITSRNRRQKTGQASTDKTSAR